MKRIESIVLFAVSTALLACAHTPDIPEMKSVKLSDGKSYSVPVGSSYTNRAVDDKVIAFYQRVGLSDCRKGDITWENAEVADDINAIMRSGSREEGVEVYEKAAYKGQIGCASPLNYKA